jgi:hypothetical protein
VKQYAPLGVVVSMEGLSDLWRLPLRSIA